MNPVHQKRIHGQFQQSTEKTEKLNENKPELINVHHQSHKTELSTKENH
jgi:hypothetical protein